MAAEDYFEYEGEMAWFGILADAWDKRDAERRARLEDRFRARPTDFPDLTNEDEEDDDPE